MNMARRRFIALGTLLGATGASTTGGLLASTRSTAQTVPIEGRYETIVTPQATSSSDKVEIVELFWYGCPHCHRFQPYIDAWQETRPDYVTFARMPAIFRKDWEIHARAYYVMVALNSVNKTHTAMFTALHGQNQRLGSKAELENFFSSHGIDPADFRRQYDSFFVDSGVRRSKLMQQRYGIRGVPTVVVNGKYRVNASLAGGYTNMIGVMNSLIQVEREKLFVK